MESDISNKFELTRYLLSSDIRLNLLISIYDGMGSIDEMKSALQKSHGNILRALNELISRDLIVKTGKTYQLSSTGFLVAMNINHLYDNWYALKSNSDFWQKHSLDNVPVQFLKRVDIWARARLVEYDTTDFSKTFKAYSERICESRSIDMILPIFSKIYMDLMLQAVEKNGAGLRIITNRNILDLIYKTDESGRFKEFVDDGKISVLLTDEILRVFFTSCDNFASLFLFFDDEYFDDSEMLLVEDEENVKKSSNVFNFYADGLR